MKNTKARTALLILLFLTVFGLFLPISNLFLKRPIIEPTRGTNAFKKASLLLQNKCADCHTPDMLASPVYSNFPIARQIIKTDIERAQEHIIFSKDMLSGESKISAMDRSRIQAAFLNEDMPPLKYLALHWNAKITKSDRQAIIDWIQENKEYNGYSYQNTKVR